MVQLMRECNSASQRRVEFRVIIAGVEETENIRKMSPWAIWEFSIITP